MPQSHKVEKARESPTYEEKHCQRLEQNELVTNTGSLTLVITTVYDAPKSSSPRSRVNSPVSVMHFPLSYLDTRMKYSIFWLVSDKEHRVELSKMPLQWAREDV